MNVPKQVIEEEIDRLQRLSGGLGVSPEVLVEASQDKDAPLHSLFEWDDTRAARLYRERQATRIIQMVKVQTLTPVGVIEHRKYEIAVPGTRYYRPVVEISREPNEMLGLLRRAHRDLRAYARRYEALSALAGESISELSERMEARIREMESIAAD